MAGPSFDGTFALKDHMEQLLAKRKQLDALIANVEKTLALREGKITMSDEEKFEGFKQRLIEDNEKKYGKEIRDKYGAAAVEQSYEKLKGMSPEEQEELTRLSEELKEVLAEAFREGDPAGETAQKAADLHKRWLGYYWSSYSKEAHASLAQMYVDDDRFRAYYDETQPGTAEFLRDAIRIYTSR